MLMYGIVISTILFIFVAALLYFCKRKRNQNKFHQTTSLMTSSSHHKLRHQQLDHHLVASPSPLVLMMTSPHRDESVLANERFGDITTNNYNHQQNNQFLTNQPLMTSSFNNDVTT